MKEGKAGADAQNDATRTEDPRRELAGVLHDVSNALTVLVGWVAEARDPAASPETVAHALAMAEQRARVARDLARRAIGVEEPSMRASDRVEDVVAEIVAALEVEAARAAARVRVEGQGRGRVIAPADLAQVITNLLLNALAHSPPGSLVRVGLNDGDDEVHVDVEDQGPGVPTERWESIFLGDTRRRGGAGVGLRHARAVARALGGDVQILARSFFRVTWPKLVGARPSAPPSARRPRVLQDRRILLVEDDADVVELLETVLTARGATVTVATDREAVFRALGSASYDALLVDLSPLGSDVTGTLEQLRLRAPGAGLVFVTGTPDALPEAVVASGAAWVRKPFEVGEVVEALLALPA